ncbi:MAG: dTMP kinase [Chloroflexota bacterium]
MFITFEGLDGSGKTTQINRLAPYLRDCEYDVLVTREPGGTEFGENVRNLLMQSEDLDADTELLLFCASRSHLVKSVIKPHISESNRHVVICDRFSDSTLAYQGYGQGIDLKVLKNILAFATDGLSPDLTFYLDIKPEEGEKRRAKSRLLGEEWNRLDDKKTAFYYKVLKGYHKLAKQEPKRWVWINAANSVEEVEEQIRIALDEFLKKPYQIERKNLIEDKSSLSNGQQLLPIFKNSHSG